jgi:hypothetical protein
LSLILPRIWNDPSPHGCRFDFLWVRNLSLHVCTLTQSPGWKTTCLCLLLALVAYTLSLSVFTTCALQLLSKLTLSSIGKWIKSIHNLKWWKFSSRMHTAIIYKLYKWQTIFPFL